MDKERASPVDGALNGPNATTYPEGNLTTPSDQTEDCWEQDGDIAKAKRCRRSGLRALVFVAAAVATTATVTVGVTVSSADEDPQHLLPLQHPICNPTAFCSRRHLGLRLLLRASRPCPRQFRLPHR